MSILEFDSVPVQVIMQSLCPFVSWGRGHPETEVDFRGRMLHTFQRTWLTDKTRACFLPPYFFCIGEYN